MTEAVYEMFWDCKYCGQKKLLGLTHRFCANCGAPQDPAARYFPPDHEKVPVHAHPYVGADVTCPSCRQPMSRAAKCCTSCGGPLARGAEVARRNDVVVPPPGFARPPMAGQARPPKKSPVWIVALVLGVFALLAGTLAVAMLWKREGVFEVRSHAWERHIDVQRFAPTRRTMWCDDKPAGARELSRRREQRGTEKVRDGETCGTRKKDLGNGTFKEVRECSPKYEDVPVMADRCDVELVEWHVARTLTEKGTSPTDPPRWPEVVIARPGTCIGCEREGSRSETYTVSFVDAKTGKDASCELPQAKWASLAKGAKYKGQMRVLTGGIDCDALEKL